MADPLDAAALAEEALSNYGWVPIVKQLAEALLAERQARVEAERQLAEADAVIWDFWGPRWSGTDKDRINRAFERHAASQAKEPGRKT